MSFRKILLPGFLLSFIFFFNACMCTKMDCDSEKAPDVRFRFNTKGSKEWIRVEFTVIDKKTKKPVKSYSTDARSSDTLLLDLKRYNDIEPSLYDYIINNSAATSDTITDITYDKVVDHPKCNSCLSFGNDYATVVNYRNFSFKHNGVKYSEEDIVTLEK